MEGTDKRAGVDDLTQQGVYLDDPREEFGDFIPADARRVADIGCGKGGFGRTLRSRLGDSAWIVGVESVDLQAQAAREGHGFDEVVSGFFPSAVPDSWTDLDLICFMDVLEHMYDPWRALYDCHDVLAPNGRVLASIPNIQYLPVLKDLLRGRWDYEDTGTLDRTHVRFFTRRSVIEMFVRAGYEVERIEGVRDVLAQFRYRRWRAAGSLLGDCRYLHFAVVARRVERPSVEVTLLAPTPLETGDRHRVETLAEKSIIEQRKRDSPVTALRRRGRHLAAIEVKFRLGLPTGLTCDYGRWRRRAEHVAPTAVPEPAPQPLPLAVVIHVFYPDLVPALLERLEVIDVPFDLVVTNASGVELDLSGTSARSVTVLEVDNRGRDVWPFLQVVQSGRLDGYDAVLKLHTKKSPQGVATSLAATSGHEWREKLVDSILGSRESFRQAFALVTEGAAGVACHDGSIAGPEDWDTNHRAVRHLARRIGLRVPAARLRFPAGSIFLMRGSLVPALQRLRMTSEDFEAEDSHAYTTTAHAVERLMGYVARSGGLEVVGLPAPSATPAD